MKELRYLNLICLCLISVFFFTSCTSTMNVPPVENIEENNDITYQTTINAVNINAQQDLLIAGNSTSPYLPVVNSIQDKVRGGTDIYISKITPQGEITWSTYFGGSLIDEAKALFCAENDEVSIAGWTQSTDLPGMKNNQKSNPQGKQFFTSLFTSDGKLKSTKVYDFPDLSQIFRHKVRLTNDHILIVADFPSTNEYNQLRKSLPIVNPYAEEPKGDIYCLFADRNGNILWSSWFGGTSISRNFNCRIDDFNKKLYITGEAKGTDFPVKNAFQNSIENQKKFDAFVSCFTYDGELAWSTLFGGDMDDTSYSVLFDRQNNVLISGSTESSNLPIQNSNLILKDSIMFQEDLKRSYSFCAKFNSDGKLIGSSYLRHTIPILRYGFDSINNKQQTSFGYSNIVTDLQQHVDLVNPYQSGPMQEDCVDYVAGSSNIIGSIDPEGSYTFFSFYGGLIEKGTEERAGKFKVINTQLNNDNRLFVIGYFQELNDGNLPKMDLDPIVYNTKDRISFLSLFDEEGKFDKMICFGIPKK